MNTITHEIISYQSNIPIKLFYQRIGTVSRHWHSSIEILFVLQGHMTVVIEDQTWELKEDDIFLINPHHIHETHSPDCSLIVVQIRLSEFKLDGIIPENIQFDCNSSGNASDSSRYFKLKHLIVMLLKNTSTSNEFTQLSNYTCAIEIIRELCLNFRQTAPISTPHSIKYLNRLKSILDYIHQNYMNRLTLTEIASREFLTPTYLSAFFEKTMGTTLSAYITKIRLGHAVFDLTATQEPIEAIAEHHGFSSARAFSSVFKKYYKMLPSEYRHQARLQNVDLKNKNANTISPPPASGCDENKLPLLNHTMLPFLPTKQNSYLELEHYDFLNKLTPYIRETPVPLSDIDTPVSSEYPTAIQNYGDISSVCENPSYFNESFKCFCGVSRASDLLLPAVQEIVCRVQKEIGFKYIKFHGILDDDLMVCQRNTDGKLMFCFTYVDMILDFLLENHLRPMIQFSFMPLALASHPQNTVFQKPVIISPPSDDNEWCHLITVFTNHLLERYGKKEVLTWIFTFWNETLGGLSFDFEDVQTSLRLYQITRQCIKDCDNRLIFASTSYSALEFPEPDYDIFLDYVREKNCLPDAWLFHFYPVVSDNNAFFASARQWKAQDFTQPVALSQDKNIFHSFLQAVTEKLPEAAHSPIYITEWNFTPSHREWLNDTCFCACYIVRNLLQNFDKASGFCHWCLTDLHQELPLPMDLFHGGMGLFTKNGIPKPSYYAYKFLNSLYSQIIFQSEGCFITKNDENFAILLYNYAHFNNLYGHGITLGTTHENWQSAFPDAQKQKLTFCLTNIPNGSYTCSQEWIRPDYGSAFEAWNAMGRPELKMPQEKEYLIAHSSPGYFSKKEHLHDHRFFYETSLAPHEIRLVRLIKNSDI